MFPVVYSVQNLKEKKYRYTAVSVSHEAAPRHSVNQSPSLVITVRTVLVIIAFVVTVNQRFVLFIFLWLCVDAVY